AVGDADEGGVVVGSQSQSAAHAAEMAELAVNHQVTNGPEGNSAKLRAGDGSGGLIAADEGGGGLGAAGITSGQQGFESVLAAGPTLVRNGEVSVNPRAEGFTDPHVLGLASRCAVGLTSANKLVFVATEQEISLRRLAKALRRLGCVEAINLDGGTSTALYYRGRWVISPGRWLVNMLAVFEKVPRSERVAAAPACPWPSALVRWHHEQAWALYTRALKLASDEAKVDLLTRACELDAENASYCLELARVLQRLGDETTAGAAYAQASRHYRAKGRNVEAFEAAQAGQALAPQTPEVIREYARAARVAGKADLARQAMQRARALFLLGPLPESKPQTLAAVVKHVASRLGACSPRRHVLAGVVTGRTLSAGSLGLYVHLPGEWDWLPLTRADAAVAQRRYMPWLVHLAVAGVPPQADLTLLREEYLRNTMLITQAPVPAKLGTAEALRFEARAMAGDEPARYQITMAKQGDLWLIVTAASEERWWAQALEEFKGVFAGLAFRPPATVQQ
ncbi:MAG: phosphodiester glycosidase family protein, partial [Armatimonadetes bacterium]|nr:phosphodiester glycosidase family protein [Armatimonadota bacterium]